MSKYLFKLSNVIQNYPWGSKTSIQELFDIDNPRQEPQAEIWMGAHANGCSKIVVDEQVTLLSEFIASNPKSILSPVTAEKFGELPYLFKVLAAGKGLSIQVHPNKHEAEVGFARENAEGIEKKCPTRNYRDSNHKPELVYALTPYQAMNGFRAFDNIIELFSELVHSIDIPVIETLLAEFIANPDSDGLECFFLGVLSLESEEKYRSLEQLLRYCEANQNVEIPNDLPALIIELSKSYSNDIGLFAPLMLNVLTLQPGEVMYLDARTPHAYLKGTALEIMANSDNVLRAGLTPKHIDIKELASCTLFEEKNKNTLLLEPNIQGNKQSYAVPVPDFKFNCFIKPENESVPVNSAEILFAIDCQATVIHSSGESITLNKGESLFIPAYANAYTLKSKGQVARAFN
ncbi:mannose-6-phosphate isomerase, class I [Vibrio ezurae]|uniref:mannose-6-phosphate isomerase n=1 Tax=Vibrio ezurae NBRC 102218 TaxID=1219080 RepID=U3B0Z8_9VIBR|nr:mannose-6-phosphate isomerase, class I [Vibrio ezurae]GAD79645.1 mannose-6-phosphate isomerase [Vibrio ezurae NBRC 102218]